MTHLYFRFPDAARQARALAAFEHRGFPYATKYDRSNLPSGHVLQVTLGNGKTSADAEDVATQHDGVPVG